MSERKKRRLSDERKKQWKLREKQMYGKYIINTERKRRKGINEEIEAELEEVFYESIRRSRLQSSETDCQ